MRNICGFALAVVVLAMTGCGELKDGYAGKPCEGNTEGLVFVKSLIPEKSTDSSLIMETQHCTDHYPNCIPYENNTKFACSEQIEYGDLSCDSGKINALEDSNNCGKCGVKCESNETCINGKCVCIENEVMCSGKTPKICHDGNWGVNQNALDKSDGSECGYVCESGACVKKICDDLEKKCENNEDGAFAMLCVGNKWSKTKCDFICSDGECRTCREGDKTCTDNNEAKVCMSNNWSIQTCGDAGCQNGVCLNCKPGTKTCGDGAVLLCDDNGEYKEDEKCDASTQVCKDNECVCDEDNGYRKCNNKCVNIRTDINNCGGCGKSFSSGGCKNGKHCIQSGRDNAVEKDADYPGGCCDADATEYLYNVNNPACTENFEQKKYCLTPSNVATIQNANKCLIKPSDEKYLNTAENCGTNENNVTSCFVRTSEEMPQSTHFTQVCKAGDCCFEAEQYYVYEGTTSLSTLGLEPLSCCPGSYPFGESGRGGYMVSCRGNINYCANKSNCNRLDQ